ncbi:MAG: MFS transporter [Bacillota bacterium]
MEKGSIKSVLTNKDLMVLWFGHAISIFGDAITFLALPYLVYEATGSKNALAFTALLRGAPIILLGLFAGALVDRWNRKRIMISSDLIRALLTLPLIVVPNEYFVITVYTVSVLKSIAGIFFNPAINSTIPAIVNKRDLNTVNSMLGFTGSTLAFVTPLIGMALIKIAGARAVLLIDMISFIVSAIAVYYINIPARANSEVRKINASGVLLDARDGIKYIIKSKPLTVIMITTMITMFGQGFIGPLWMPYVVEVLNKPAIFIGKLGSNQSLGALLGNILVMLLGLRAVKSYRKMYSFFVLMTGVTIFMQITTGSFDVFIMWGFSVGVFISGMNVATQTIMQQATRKDFMGRISSVFFLINQGFYLMSISLVAVVGDLISTRNLLVFACAIWLIGCVIGSVAMMFVKEGSMSIYEHEAAEEGAAAEKGKAAENVLAAEDSH